MALYRIVGALLLLLDVFVIKNLYITPGGVGPLYAWTFLGAFVARLGLCIFYAYKRTHSSGALSFDYNYYGTAGLLIPALPLFLDGGPKDNNKEILRERKYKFLFLFNYLGLLTLFIVAIIAETS